jgi:hypothetical protein
MQKIPKQMTGQYALSKVSQYLVGSFVIQQQINYKKVRQKSEKPGAFAAFPQSTLILLKQIKP